MFLRRTLPLIFATLILPSAQAETAAQAVYRKVSPFVVVVRATEAEGKAQGSGVIIGENEIATNCHVIEDAETIAVYRTEEDEPLAATLSRGDYGRDICILSVPRLQNAEAVAIRKSKTLEVGEDVFAVGSPQGFDSTISPGIVSQLRALAGTPPLIQTNAPMSEGSSGGGLFDADGNLVGLTTFYYGEGQNLNFAVPTEWLEEVGEKPAGEVAGKDEEAEAGASVGFLDRALELEIAEDWQGLLEHCRRWTDTEPWNSVAWKNLGNAYDQLSRYTDAIAAYREALRIDPEYAYAWFLLGDAHFELGRYGDTIDAYHELLRIDPENASAWFLLGITYDELDRHTDAISAYREALRINPEYAHAWNRLGTAYIKLGRHTDAIAATREALRIDPEDASSWSLLGLAYAILRRYDDAIAATREALRIDPENAHVWKALSIAYDLQGRDAEADEARQQYLRLKVLNGE